MQRIYLLVRIQHIHALPQKRLPTVTALTVQRDNLSGVLRSGVYRWNFTSSSLSEPT
jgi:hypothetical protein